MATNVTIPVTVSAEAKAWIDQLGMQHEYEQMVAHAKQTLPGLKAIEVGFDEDPDKLTAPGVILLARREHPGPGYDATHRRWRDWLIATFPPKVLLNFTLLSVYEGEPDGR
jgi:hypothetical protein